ncbi:MAG: cupin domain-containing protein, partial [Myxococcaceae bacterium]
ETVDSLARDAVPVAPSPEARRRLLRTIRGPARFADLLPAIAQLFDLPLEEVRAMVDGLFDPSRWMEGPAPGISLFPVQTGPRYPEAFAGFVRVLPGRKFPSHRHTGAELNLVLQGGLREVDTGKEVWAGEQLTKDAGSEHAYVALEGSDCIAASVVNGFIELTDSGGDA